MQPRHLGSSFCACAQRGRHRCRGPTLVPPQLRASLRSREVLQCPILVAQGELARPPVILLYTKRKHKTIKCSQAARHCSLKQMPSLQYACSPQKRRCLKCCAGCSLKSPGGAPAGAGSGPGGLLAANSLLEGAEGERAEGAGPAGAADTAADTAVAAVAAVAGAGASVAGKQSRLQQLPSPQLLLSAPGSHWPGCPSLQPQKQVTAAQTLIRNSCGHTQGASVLPNKRTGERDNSRRPSCPLFSKNYFTRKPVLPCSNDSHSYQETSPCLSGTAARRPARPPGC